MTKLVINIEDVDGFVDGGETVYLRSPEVRPSNKPSTVVTSRWREFHIPATGTLTVDVVPGPLEIEFLHGNGEAIYVDVPSSGTAYLADLLWGKRTAIIPTETEAIWAAIADARDLSMATRPKNTVASRNVADIQVVNAMPKNPDPATLYLVVGTDASEAPGTPVPQDYTASYQFTGFLKDGQTLPNTPGTLSSESFIGPTNGWLSWGDNGVVPPKLGRWELTVHSPNPVGWVEMVIYDLTTKKFIKPWWSFGGSATQVVEIGPDHIIYFNTVSYKKEANTSVILTATLTDKPLTTGTPTDSAPRQTMIYEVSGGMDKTSTTFPDGTGVTKSGFIDRAGWYVDANHGLTVEHAGRYEVKVESLVDGVPRHVGAPAVYPWYASTGTFGKYESTDAAEHVTELNLTPSDVFYPYVYSESFVGDLTMRVTATMIME